MTIRAAANVSSMNMGTHTSIDDKLKTLAYRVLLSRRDLEWSQEELAQKAGVSRGHISKIERGDTINVTVEVAYAIADALGVSRAYLLGLTDDPLRDIPDEENLETRSALQTLDRLTKEFLSIFQQLDDNKRATLLDLAKMLRSADAPRIIGEDS